MFCPKCGSQIADDAQFCAKCGQPVSGDYQAQWPVTPVPEDPIAALIPYKNMQGLIAYYLGIFSIVPCFGIILGIPALIYGLKGLKYSQEHPEAKGRTHAWVGVVGGIFGIIWILAAGIALVATRLNR